VQRISVPMLLEPVPQVRYGLSVLLMEVFCTLSIPSICRHVQRQ
jgi:hypothetical protein